MQVAPPDGTAARQTWDSKPLVVLDGLIPHTNYVSIDLQAMVTPYRERFMEDLINAMIYHPLVVTITKHLTDQMCNVDFCLAGAFTLACTLSLQLFRVLLGNAYNEVPRFNEQICSRTVMCGLIAIKRCSMGCPRPGSGLPITTMTLPGGGQPVRRDAL